MIDHEEQSELAPLKYPWLASSGNGIVASGDMRLFVQLTFNRWLRGNRYLLKHGGNERVRMDFLIDREGQMRRVLTRGFRREGLRPLSWLVDLVLREVEIEPGQSWTVGEVLKTVTPYKSPPGFPTAGHLKGYLRKKPSEALFDARMFRDFWNKHCPEIPESAWTQEYP